MMLTSPKYHCKLPGEGVEYAWGFMKRNFRNYSLKEKNTKEKSNKAVRESVELVSVQNVSKFSGRCRHYMMTYQNMEYNNKENVTFDMIEKYTGKLKTHCNVGDIEKAWREAIGVKNN